MASLNILHVFRAPVGGLFRHVLDLTREQIARGHRVGLIADLTTGGMRAEEALRAIEPSLALGLSRVAMRRQPGPGDLPVLVHVMRRATASQADVVHGHGAKGGAFSRLVVRNPRALRVYTPHGGSMLYGHDSLAGRIYLTTEQMLMRRSDLFLFESAYSADMFRSKVGEPRAPIRIVHNGVSPAEFDPVEVQSDATDLVFLGEMRLLKGIDVLIDAIAALRSDGRNISASLIGDGPDKQVFQAQTERLGLTGAVRFLPPMPVRYAMALGRIMAAPSRAESFPYVVLEAAAAAKPLITTRVGGIPEIFGPLSDSLIPPGSADALASAIIKAMDDPQTVIENIQKLRQRVQASFSVESMASGVLYAYQAALENLAKTGRR